MRHYIYEQPDWPAFTWQGEQLAPLLTDIHHRQGRLMGRMEALGFTVRTETLLQTLTQDVIKSSEIEGEQLDKGQVRSSVARRLGIDIGGLPSIDRHIDGVVEMMLDATRQFDAPLTQARLFHWHAAMFPTGYSGMLKIKVGTWRDDAQGPMQVVSGPIGREKIHFEAPAAPLLETEMARFLAWFNHSGPTDWVLKAALGHLWFVTLHPFDDGNGRIARAITDMALARSEGSSQRFYSMSAQIQQERKQYYRMLEQSQHGPLDVTPWLDWFLHCLSRAIDEAQGTLTHVMNKAQFWEQLSTTPLNPRQKAILTRLLDGFEGNLTTSKWAKLTKCSQDTAYRDILDLVEKGVLIKNPQGGRSTSYMLRIEN